MDELNDLLSGLPGYTSLTTSMKQRALDGSLVPDSAGVWPGSIGYQTTYDVYFAALRLLGVLRGQPFVKQSSSEGTSVTVDAPDWGAVAAYFRDFSTIVGAQGATVIQQVPINTVPHVTPVDMGGGDSYGDIDSDLG